VSEAQAEYAALVTALRSRLEQQLAEILILHADETAEELTLLKNLTTALDQKVAPTRLLPATEFIEIAEPKLLVATGRAFAAMPELARHRPFDLGQVDQYVQTPALRKSLWDDLKAAFQGAA
jgi:hypothetical protein